jgi:pimeloyl-ACP methyl ester carboxylesterase
MARKAAIRRKRVPRRPKYGSSERTKLAPGTDPALLKAMSLRVAVPGKGEHRLAGSEIEQALLSGDHARTLETYFGETEYAELRQLAARATRRSVRGGPRVLILPGILGSLLNYVTGKDEDCIWIDFVGIALGRLKDLRIPGKKVRAFDAHQATYLKLKLWLRDQGFDADFHYFDWRLDIPELGKELANRIAGEAADKIYLVAHSMGGLVARAAFNYGVGNKIERLVMLGTPNFGSFAPAMVFRGVYPFVNKIAALDLTHSAEELAGQVFNTHPGLTQMLPQRAKFSAVDLYDMTKWPTKGARPLPSILAAAPSAQQKLAIVAPKFVMIAGVDRETTVGLRVAGAEFTFERSRAGDGTVPVDLAVLPDVLTYYLAEEHGSLPKNASIHKAVVDILRTGSTAMLSDRWDSTRGDAIAEIRESELRERFRTQATRSPAQLSATDLRNIIAELAAPSTPTGAAAEPGLVPAAAAPTHVWQSLVIGRRSQRRIDVRLARGSITQIKSRAYVLGLFEGVAPAGAASAMDALMGGVISEFRQRRMFSSGVGEVFTIPGGRTDVRTDYVVFAGLGRFETFNLQVLDAVAENIARTLVRTDIEEFATVPIGAGTGLELEQVLESLLRGFFRGLEDADRDQHFRSVTFCEVDDARFEALKWALYRLSSTPLCEGVEMTLTEVHLPPAPVTRRDPGTGLPPLIYLNVRVLREKRALAVESSLLTTGYKATVMSGVARLQDKELNEHLQLIESQAFNYKALHSFGEKLAELLLDKAIAAGLRGCMGNHLVVVHDAEASRVPWETLCIDGKFPAIEGGMSRRYLASNLSVAKWLEQRQHGEWLDVLLVVNPTEDLDGAKKEGDRVEKLLGNRKYVKLSRIEGKAATRARLRSELGSGTYDIMHYAGHAHFDPVQIARSGIYCSDGPLPGAELAEMSNMPSLVFFNACESARVRKNMVDNSKHVTKNLRDRLERSVGLAEAFLRGGVANYIGTYWPVEDASAEVFASAFYARLIEGNTIGDALEKGRAEVNKIKSQDWADYIFYGSVDFRVKYRET